MNGSRFCRCSVFSRRHLDTLQSYFMTMYGFPNLLVDARLNVSRLSSEKKLLVDQLLPRCLDLGFVSEDSSQGVLNLKEIGGRRISQVKSQLDHFKFLHPLTLILEEDGAAPFAFSSKLINTKELLLS